jgi:fatty acid-binding protein DegV
VNGYLVPGKKYRGSFDRALKKMIKDFFESYDIDPETILIVGAPSVEDNYKEIILNLLRENGVEEARWMRAGAVISCHGGPGAIGITGIENREHIR